MVREKIRISLNSFDHKLINQACSVISNLLAESSSSSDIRGPISMPTRKRIYCVLRSPHVDKDSREQFELRRYKKIIDIYPDSKDIFDAFLKIQVPAGVSINIQIYQQNKGIAA